MSQQQPPTTQLLIRFSIPFTVNCDEVAKTSAAQFAPLQHWQEGYEVRRAKEKKFEDLRPDGSVWAKYEVFGRFDVQAMSQAVMKRLEERAREQVPVTSALVQEG